MCMFGTKVLTTLCGLQTYHRTSKRICFTNITNITKILWGFFIELKVSAFTIYMCCLKFMNQKKVRFLAKLGTWYLLIPSNAKEKNKDHVILFYVIFLLVLF